MVPSASENWFVRFFFGIFFVCVRVCLCVCFFVCVFWRAAGQGDGAGSGDTQTPREESGFPGEGGGVRAARQGGFVEGAAETVTQPFSFFFLPSRRSCRGTPLIPDLY